MNIQLIDGQCTVTWERTSAEIHGEILERLKRISGASFDKSASCWRVPALQADRLYAAFPKASYCYDTIAAVVDAQERRIGVFGRNLLAMGVMLAEVDGRLIAQGDGVSPLLQSLIDERSAKLAAWLKAHNAISGAWQYPESIVWAKVKQFHVYENCTPSSEELDRAKLIATSLKNAANNQHKQDKMLRRRQRRKHADSV